MPSISYCVAVYWPARKESPGQIAARAEQYFRGLRRIDPVFTGWRLVSEKRKEANLRVATSRDKLEPFVAAGMHRDYYGAAIPECGFDLWLSILRSDGGSSMVSIHAGAYSPWLGNNCILYLPPSGRKSSDLLTVNILGNILREAVISWDADWGRVSNWQIHDVLEKPKRKFDVGWLTYITNRKGPLPKISGPARVEALDDRGHVVIATDERFAADNAIHRRTIRRLNKILSPILA